MSNKSHSSNTTPPVYDLEVLQQRMMVIPVPFNNEHKRILAQCKEMLEANKKLR